MAEAIYNDLTKSKDAFSAGTTTGSLEEPEGQLLKDIMPENFFEVMEEHNINIRENKTKRLIPEMLEKADIIVSMAEEPYVPDFLKNNKKVIWWNVENPVFVTRKIAEDTYDIIFPLVQDLISKQ